MAGEDELRSLAAPVLPPETPKRVTSKRPADSARTADELNELTRSISKEFNLNLPVRGEDWSPSKRRKSAGDEATSTIKVLYFKNRGGLQKAIADFRVVSPRLQNRDERLNSLLDGLKDAKYLTKGISSPNRQLFTTASTGHPPSNVHVPFDDSHIETPGSPTLNIKHAPEVRLADIPSLPPPFTGTTRSGQTSVLTSFATTASTLDDSKVSMSTAATSFDGGFDGANDAADDPGSSMFQPPWDEHDIDHILPAVAVDGTNKRPRTSRCACLHNDGSSLPAPNAHTDSHLGPHAQQVPRQEIKPVHHQVRNLPYLPFDDDDPLCEALDNLPFELRVECLRIAKAAGLKTCQLPPITSKQDFDSFVQSDKCPPVKYQPSSRAVWDIARSDRDPRITFSGSIKLNESNEGPLFMNTIRPLRMEDSCRYQRHFGWDRFLYLDVPALDKGLPSHVSGFKADLREAFRKWQLTENVFMGRKWRMLHIQPIKTKRRRGYKGTVNSPAHRVVFFAISGEGIPPIRLSALLDWHLVFASNLHQQSSKLFARIELALSATKPTYAFKPSQIRLLPEDMLADGDPEDPRFNDPNLNFPASYDPITIMNDGCARISVGAAKLVCESFGILPGPSAFQARINGAKGIWFISAPYDTTDQHHLDVWIEITPSQVKIKPRESDLIDTTCEADRWSFDVVQWSRKARASYLHRDFMQILEDRGVPRAVLKTYIAERLHEECDAQINALDDPVALRLWTDKQFGSLEDSLEMDASGLPRPAYAKVSSLLKTGFLPKPYKPLAECTTNVFEQVLLHMRQNLRFECPRSTTVLGIADPIGCLQPGEIHLCFSEAFSDKLSGQSWAFLYDLEALVARHPTLWPSDIQKVRIVFKPELAHLRDVVVFPSRGCTPLASKLQGGDYDGDTFWVCWDKALTSHFQNAPTPKPPKLEDMGITKKTQLIGDFVLPRDGSFTNFNLDDWLSDCFTFNYELSLLGKVTNYFYKLAYRKNDLWDTSLADVASLHDCVIDGPKQGYIFTAASFHRFLETRSLPYPEKLDMPDYRVTGDEERATAKGPTKSSTLREMVFRPHGGRSKHILDEILYKVIDPGIAKTLNSIDEKLVGARTQDDELETAHQAELHEVRDDAELVQLLKTEIAALREQFAELGKKWSLTFTSLMDREKDYIDCVIPCYEEYQKIRPQNPRHHFLRGWLARSADLSPSKWESFKASVLASTLHRQPKLMFAVARDALCEMKAHNALGHEAAACVAAILRPKKPKDRRFEQLQVRVSVADDEYGDFDLGVDDIGS